MRAGGGRQGTGKVVPPFGPTPYTGLLRPVGRRSAALPLDARVPHDGMGQPPVFFRLTTFSAGCAQGLE